MEKSHPPHNSHIRLSPSHIFSLAFIPFLRAARAHWADSDTQKERLRSPALICKGAEEIRDGRNNCWAFYFDGGGAHQKELSRPKMSITLSRRRRKAAWPQIFVRPLCLIVFICEREVCDSLCAVTTGNEIQIFIPTAQSLESN
jgi:hypothetical protein